MLTEQMPRTTPLFVRISVPNHEWVMSEVERLNYNTRTHYMNDLLSLLRVNEKSFLTWVTKVQKGK